MGANPYLDSALGHVRRFTIFVFLGFIGLGDGLFGGGVFVFDAIFDTGPIQFLSCSEVCRYGISVSVCSAFDISIREGNSEVVRVNHSIFKKYG